MNNKYEKYSGSNLEKHKDSWDQDFFNGVKTIDIIEIFFIFTGILTFLFLCFEFKISFIVALILFYWFKIKWIENKIIKSNQFLILGIKSIQESIKNTSTTDKGIKPIYDSHKRGFNEYINFLETQRNHLVARMVILNLFALVLLEIIK